MGTDTAKGVQRRSATSVPVLLGYSRGRRADSESRGRVARVTCVRRKVAQTARDWLVPFREAFPDERMETVALVGEGDAFVSQFCCSGTHTGSWVGRPAPAGHSAT